MANQNSIQEEIRYRLKVGNSCYNSVQTLLSSRLLSKNFKIKKYKTIILPVVLYGCEAWSLTLREKRRLRVFESKILRRINPIPLISIYFFNIHSNIVLPSTPSFVTESEFTFTALHRAPKHN